MKTTLLLLNRARGLPITLILHGSRDGVRGLSSEALIAWLVARTICQSHDADEDREVHPDIWATQRGTGLGAFWPLLSSRPICSPCPAGRRTSKRSVRRNLPRRNTACSCSSASWATTSPGQDETTEQQQASPTNNVAQKPGEDRQEVVSDRTDHVLGIDECACSILPCCVDTGRRRWW